MLNSTATTLLSGYNAYSSQQSQINALSIATKAFPKDSSQEKTKEAAKDFESNFLSQMLNTLFDDTTQVDSLFGGGVGEENFRSMLVDEYGKKMSENGGIGIAQNVLKEMLKLQEVQ